MKRSDGTGRPLYLIVGMVFYLLGCIPVVLAFKKTEFGLVFIVWESITVVLGIAIGRALFGEPVTLSRALAVIFAVIALTLSQK